MAADQELPVKVDVGLSAKAEIQVKAEVPQKSAGNFLDAITDIFRPFSEARGLKGDIIRLQREDVLLQIAYKARQRANVEDPEKPISLKFAVPFLEKASTEDSNSPLIDWWASLLVEASKNEDAQHPLFVDFLSKMTPREAVLLDSVWTDTVIQDVKHEFKDIYDLTSVLFRRNILAINPNLSAETFDNDVSIAALNTISDCKERGVLCSYFKFPTSKGSPKIQESWDFVALDNCVALGIMKRTNVVFDTPTPFIGEFSCAGEFYALSDIGRLFLKACIG